MAVITSYAPRDLGNGREGVEFAGVISVPAGSNPFEVVRGLRDIITDNLDEYSPRLEAWLLEDIGLWPEPEGQHAAGAEKAEEEPYPRFIRHSNQLGDWCPWSGWAAEDGDDGRCPAGCPGSAVEEGGSS